MLEGSFWEVQQMKEIGGASSLVAMIIEENRDWVMCCDGHLSNVLQIWLAEGTAMDNIVVLVGRPIGVVQQRGG